MRKGFQGIKPGWCRVGFHYAMDDAEAAFVVDAVQFVAAQGYRFLPLYASINSFTQLAEMTLPG